MHIKVFFMVTALLFLTAKADPDPRTFTASTPTPRLPSPSALPEYEEKEVIVYLTQDQVKALQTGQGVLESQSEDSQEDQGLVQSSEENYDNDEQLRENSQWQKSYVQLRSNSDINQNQEKVPAPVKEPNQEEPQEELSQTLWYSKADNTYGTQENLDRSRYYVATSERPEEKKYFVPASELIENNRYYAVASEKPEDVNAVVTTERPESLPHKSFNYYSVYNEKKGDNIDIKIFHPTSKDRLRENLEAKQLETQKDQSQSPIKKFKLVPYEYQSKTPSKVESTQELLQRIRKPQKNTRDELEFVVTPIQDEERIQAQKREQENSDETQQNSDEDVSAPRYTFRYNDQRQAIKVQDLIKKQKAADIKNKHPVEHRTKVITTDKEPKPYVLRLPQQVEVKVSKPYSAPLELIRRVPVQIVETENVEAESPANYEVKKRIPNTDFKKVNVKIDKPYLIERIVPVDVRKESPAQVTPQKLRILGRVWRHLN